MQVNPLPVRGTSPRRPGRWHRRLLLAALVPLAMAAASTSTTSASYPASATLSQISGQNGITCTTSFALWFPDQAQSATKSDNFVLCTSDGRWANFQSDGNFVLYTAKGHATWASNTYLTGSKIVLLGDGNIVIYSASGHVLWTSRGNVYSSTHRVNYYRLELQSDGNLVEYAFPHAGGRVAIWASNTQGT